MTEYVLDGNLEHCITAVLVANGANKAANNLIGFEANASGDDSGRINGANLAIARIVDNANITGLGRAEESTGNEGNKTAFKHRYRLSTDYTLEFIALLGVENQLFAVFIDFASVLQGDTENLRSFSARSGRSYLSFGFVTEREHVTIGSAGSDIRITVASIRIESGNGNEGASNASAI